MASHKQQRYENANPYTPVNISNASSLYRIDSAHMEYAVDDGAGLRQVDNYEHLMQQEKAFTGWVNAHLSKKQMHITSLVAAISAVVPLIYLLEILNNNQRLKGIKRTHKHPRHRFDRLDALRIIIKHIVANDRRGMRVSYDVETLISGQSLKLCLALIWRIIVNFSIDEPEISEVMSGIENENNDMSKKYYSSPEERLLYWCNDHLPKQKQVKNFTKDFQSGLTFCYLLNHALRKEDQLSHDDIEDLDADELLNGIFNHAEKHLAIPQLLTVDMLLKNPNKQAVMTYISLVRTAVENRKEERSKLNQSMAQMKKAFHSLEDGLKSRVQFLEKQLEANKLEFEVQNGILINERTQHAIEIENWNKERLEYNDELEELRTRINEMEEKKA